MDEEKTDGDMPTFDAYGSNQGYRIDAEGLTTWARPSSSSFKVHS